MDKTYNVDQMLQIVAQAFDNSSSPDEWGVECTYKNILLNNIRKLVDIED